MFNHGIQRYANIKHFANLVYLRFCERLVLAANYRRKVLRFWHRRDGRQKVGDAAPCNFLSNDVNIATVCFILVADCLKAERRLD